MHRPSLSSLRSQFSDNDMVMPKNTSPGVPARGMDRSRQSSTCSERSCEGMSLDETRELWMCMLELQLRYGCYNSSRLDMALSAGDSGCDLMPNRFIIDTLNESVVDMPEEAREMLNRHLCPTLSSSKVKRRFWQR